MNLLFKIFRLLVFIGLFWPLPGAAGEFAQDLSSTFAYIPRKYDFNLKYLMHNMQEYKDSPFNWLTNDIIDNALKKHLMYDSYPVVQIDFVSINTDVSKDFDYSFDVQKTPITQWQYMMLMADDFIAIPSYVEDREDSIVAKVGGKRVRIKLNHPIENISVNNAQDFINKLNELDASSDQLIYTLIPDHIPGDKYRLLSDVEYEILVIGGEPNWWQNRIILEERSWYAENSHIKEAQCGTHSVGLKKPNDFGLYDILGHVLHLTLVAPKRFVARGGGWRMPAQFLKPSRRRLILVPSKNYNYVGFRLVRDRANPVFCRP